MFKNDTVIIHPMLLMQYAPLNTACILKWNGLVLFLIFFYFENNTRCALNKIFLSVQSQHCSTALTVRNNSNTHNHPDKCIIFIFTHCDKRFRGHGYSFVNIWLDCLVDASWKYNACFHTTVATWGQDEMCSGPPSAWAQWCHQVQTNLGDWAGTSVWRH